MSDSGFSDTLSTISTVSSLTNSDRSDSPPPYSPPRIYAEPEFKPSDPEDDETLSSTLATSSSSTWRGSSKSSPSPVPRSHSPQQQRKNIRRSEPSISSPSTLASPSPVPRSHSPPQPRKNIRRKGRGHSYDYGSSSHNNNDSNRNRSSPRARPPRQDHPPRLPMASSPPPHPLIPSFPSNPPPPPRAPDPPANMYMGANPWMHPAQGFSIHQSASPSGASQSIHFHGPAIPPSRPRPQNYYPPNIPNNVGMGMDGMEDMRRGMEDMRRNMQRGMEEMRNSMRQAHLEMNAAFHNSRPHRHSHGSRISNHAGSMVVIGNQAYGADGTDGTLVINNSRVRGPGRNWVSVNGIQVGQDSGVWQGERGRGPGTYASVSSTGGGQAVSQTYVGNDGVRYTYSAYQGP